MSTNNTRTSTPLICALLSVPLLSCSAEPGTASQYEPAPVAVVGQEMHWGSSSVQVQHEISQALWGCYAVGADLIGVGDVHGAKDVLRKCYSDDMVFEAIMPPAYADLGFTSSGGADGFVDAGAQVYGALGFTRTQHLITNIVVQRTGPNSATVYSGALAVHTYADEHVFNASVRFVDEMQRIDGTWKFTHRTMNVISVSEADAWTP